MAVGSGSGASRKIPCGSQLNVHSAVTEVRQKIGMYYVHWEHGDLDESVRSIFPLGTKY